MRLATDVYAPLQNSLRRALWPALDTALSVGGGYASYPLRHDEYAVTLPVDLSEARRVLWEVGYRPAPVAALKTDPYGTTSRGSWVYRRRSLWRAERQNHVHLIPEGGRTHLYVHWETNWWPAPDDLGRMYRHYRPPSKGGSADLQDPYAYDWAEGQRILETQLDHGGYGYDYDATRIA